MQLSTEDLELIMDVCRCWLRVQDRYTSQDEEVRQLMQRVQFELEALYLLM